MVIKNKNKTKTKLMKKLKNNLKKRHNRTRQPTKILKLMLNKHKDKK